MTGTRQERSTWNLPEPKDGTPLYVHLPFCVAKCHYCDFFSVAAEGQDVDGTLKRIEEEIRARAPRSPRTVFVGGGTPSLLSRSQLERLFTVLEARTGFRSSAREVTAECNPESLDEDKTRCLLELGVDRISIGFQSLDEETLQLFGRAHSVEQSFRAYEAARRAGARNVNIDLIYASPGQRLEQWRADLARVLALGPDHVSAYNLTFEEETPFRRWLAEGRLKALPEEVELEFLAATRQALSDAGVEPYEISNYARSGRHCEHNLNYWHNGEYLGVGPSAVSKLGLARFGNVRTIGEYRKKVAQQERATAWCETPEPRLRLAESWWLGLRLSAGRTAPELWTSAGLADWSTDHDPALLVARGLADQGLLECLDEHWRMTERGLPLADAIAREFLRWAQRPASPSEPAELAAPLR